MKTTDFINVINTVPRYTPVFIVGKVPTKYEDILKEGDEVTCIGRGEAYEHTKTKELLRIGASYLEFKEYRQVVRKSKLYSGLYGKAVKKARSKKVIVDNRWTRAVKFFTTNGTKVHEGADGIVVNNEFTFYPSSNEWQRNGYNKRYFSRGPEDFYTRFVK